MPDARYVTFQVGICRHRRRGGEALGATIPLIPVGLRYTVGKRWTAHVRFGDPLSAGDFVSREALVGKLEQDVAALSNLRRWAKVRAGNL